MVPLQVMCGKGNQKLIRFLVWSSCLWIHTLFYKTICMHHQIPFEKLPSKAPLGKWTLGLLLWMGFGEEKCQCHEKLL